MAERLQVTVDDYGYIDDLTYDRIVATFGSILAEASDDDYQGDSLYLIDNAGRYGILTFGWGSCSGCDALAGCHNQADVDELQDDLERGIKWFDTLGEASEYLAGDGLADSYLQDSLVEAFTAKVSDLKAAAA